TALGEPGQVRAPDGVDLVELVRRSAGPPPVTGTARIWVAAGQALGLRRVGRMVGSREHDGRPGEEFELEMRSRETVARWVAGHGPDVAVISPPELAAEVRRAWTEALAVHTTTDSEPVAVGGR